MTRREILAHRLETLLALTPEPEHRLPSLGMAGLMDTDQLEQRVRLGDFVVLSRSAAEAILEELQR